MKKYALVAVILLIVATASPAAAVLKDMNFIRDVKVTHTQSGAVVDLSMDLAHDASDIEQWRQGSSREIRFRMPRTWVDPPTRNFRQSDSDMLRLVKVYQLNSSTAVVSLFLSAGIDSDDVRVKTNLADGRIRFIMDAGQSAAAAPLAEEDRIGPPIDLDKVFGEAKMEKPEKGLVDDDSKTADASELKDTLLAGAPNGVIGSGVPNLGLSLVKTVSALAAVIALIFILAAVGKRFLKDSPIFTGAPKGQMVKLLSSTPIDAKKRVAVLDVAGEIIVVGVGENQINMLMKIDDPQTIERIKGSPDNKSLTPNIAADKVKQDGESGNCDNVFHKEFNQRISVLKAAVGTESAYDMPREAGYGALQAIRDKMAGMKKL